MKRILSLILVSVLLISTLCFVTSCGAVNKTEVSILWRGESEATVPGSLIDCFERAMYIENIDYKHYGANNNSETQLNQAVTAIANGCAVLLVELVSASSAQQIVDAAQVKDIPVIFFNCNVSEEVIKSYDKCVLVTDDETSVAEVQGTLIADYLKANYKNLDKNGDLKISFCALGATDISKAAVAKAEELLASKDYKIWTFDGWKFINISITPYDGENSFTKELIIDLEKITSSCEMIITENDEVASQVLFLLQGIDYNTDKLVDQFVPIFTIGNNFDYKNHVVKDRPAIPENLIINDSDSDKVIKDKNSEIKKLKDLRAYYESKKFIVDLTSVNESDLKNMIYTTINVIDAGRLAGTVISDNDSISLTVAKIAVNFIKGNDTFKDVDAELVKDSVVRISKISH